MAKAKKSAPKTNGKGKGATADGLKVLEAAVKKALAAVRASRAELDKHELASMTSDDRQHSAGKLRDGEEAAMIAVLDTVDAHPGQFASLAPHDHGKDDAVVETGPSRTALARRALLAPLATELDAFLTRVGDDMLVSAALAKDVTVPAYGIIRANAPLNAALRTSAAAAIDFHAGPARKRAAKAKKPPKG
jgi:hypothetical protein